MISRESKTVSVLLGLTVAPIFFAFFVCADISWAGRKRVTSANRLFGHWKVVSVKASGDVGRWFADAQELFVLKASRIGTTIIPSRIVLLPKTGEVVTLDYDLMSDAKPQKMDLILKGRGKPQTIPCIFVVDGDKLRLCIGKNGRPENFAVKEGADRVLLVLRRQKE